MRAIERRLGDLTEAAITEALTTLRLAPGLLSQRLGRATVENYLRGEARRAPLHRLRYRWSLRRRAPAWRRRAAGRPLRKSDWRVRPGTWDWENTRTGEISLLHPKTLAICRQHDPWDCPDCGAENQPSNRACDRCGGLPIRQAAA